MALIKIEGDFTEYDLQELSKVHGIEMIRRSFDNKQKIFIVYNKIYIPEILKKINEYNCFYSVIKN